MRGTWLLVLVACSEREAARPPVPASEHATGSANAVDPDVDVTKLPICGTADPLAVACQLGQPVAVAHFECPPSDVLIHEWSDTNRAAWACDYTSRPHQPVEYDLVAPVMGMKPKDGEALSDADRAWTSKRFQPSGAIEAVKVTFHAEDEPTAKRRAAVLAQQARSWGCIGSPAGHQLECGTWSVKIVEDAATVSFVARRDDLDEQARRP